MGTEAGVEEAVGIPLNPIPYTIPNPEEMEPCLSASISPVLPARNKSLSQDFFPDPPVRFVPQAATVILLVCPPAPFVQQVRTIPRAEAPRQQLANSALLAVTAALWANRPALHVPLDISALSAAPLRARPARLVSFAQPQDRVEDVRAPRATTAPPPPPFKSLAQLHLIQRVAQKTNHAHHVRPELPAQSPVPLCASPARLNSLLPKEAHRAKRLSMLKLF